jgi:UDP-glucose 4-epimerase
MQLYHTLYGMDYCILRVANPYGERQRLTGSQGVVTFFLHKALENEPVEIWGDGSVVRDYLYILDVIDALRHAMNFAGEPRIFNIGSGAGKRLNEIIEAIEQLLGRPIERRYLPARPFDVPINVLDTTLAHKHLGWQPRVSLRDGLARTLEWMKNRRGATGAFPSQ